MIRRDFVTVAIGAMLSSTLEPMPILHAREKKIRKVRTVTGDLHAHELGVTLPHEHLFADIYHTIRVHDELLSQRVLTVVLPRLLELHSLGGRALLDATQANQGRDVRLLKRLSLQSGIRIITNTGYDAASQGQHLPECVRRENSAEIAQRWLRECESGIDGTNVYPGVIKVGLDDEDLGETGVKMIDAAVRTHQKTGLPIALRTTTGTCAKKSADLCIANGVNPDRLVWLHAQSEADPRYALEIAAAGGWIEFNSMGGDLAGIFTESVMNISTKGLLGRLLLSAGADCVDLTDPSRSVGGVAQRSYREFFLEFLVRLREGGLSDADITQIMVENPATAFRIVA